MDTTRETRLSPRGRRALPLIALALIVIAGTSFAYLHPSLPTLLKAAAPTKPAGPPLLSDKYQVAYDFLTSTLGWALVVEQASSSPRFWVFRTTDGAKHWQSQFIGPASTINTGPLKVQFFDRNNGLVALGGAESVYRTQDGGGHWTALALPTFSLSSLFFSDPLHGWVLGSIAALDQTAFRLFSTSDGGDQWTVLPQPPTWFYAGKGGSTAFGFRRPTDGWMGGAVPGRPTVYSTVDGGVTWLPHVLPVDTSSSFTAGGLLAESQVVLLPGAGVLATTIDRSGNSVGLTSFDSGSTWHRLPPPPGETNYGSFIFQDALHWWALRYGTLFKSSDAGQSWKEAAQQLDEWDYMPQIVDARHAWAQMVAVFPSANRPHGTGLAVTADGGVHWDPVRVPQPS